MSLIYVRMGWKFFPTPARGNANGISEFTKQKEKRGCYCARCSKILGKLNRIAIEVIQKSGLSSNPRFKRMQINVIVRRCFVGPDTGWKGKEYGNCFYSIENYCGLSSLMRTRIRHIRCNRFFSATPARGNANGLSEFTNQKEKRGCCCARCLCTRHIKAAVSAAKWEIKGDIARKKIDVVLFF